LPALKAADGIYSFALEHTKAEYLIVVLPKGELQLLAWGMEGVLALPLLNPACMQVCSDQGVVETCLFDLHSCCRVEHGRWLIAPALKVHMLGKVAGSWQPTYACTCTAYLQGTQA
jgi:hypothetical protein